MLVPLTILLLSNYILAYDGEPRLYYDLEEAEDYFSWFVNRYNKTYTKYETKMRFEIFKHNLKTVNEDNSGLYSPVFGITPFSDLTVQEFIQKYTGLKHDDSLSFCSKETVLNVQMRDDVPDHFDWRDHNIVTPVRNQLDCKSYWAFAATANVESMYALKTGKLVDLSPQQLIDCDEDSSGCKRGTVGSALWYMILAGGLENEADYKYTATQGKCKFDKSKIEVKVDGCSVIEMYEGSAKEYLFRNGPLTIGVDAKRFHGYTGGILLNCEPGPLNHAALLIGYGSDSGTDYWIVKNSWGEEFGEKGYIRLERGKNACGLADFYFEQAQIAD